ncbi:hypothetical protein [Kineococcus esterisolvens]|uniref:hypothetical protein n=1 Tax=unclassified Kineococcus TaxID=2621656 RepID=UPI003D7C3AAB
MAADHTNLTVSTTAASLTRPPGVGQSWSTPRAVSMQNAGGASVFIGGADVTPASFGYELGAGDRVAFDLDPDDELFGITASGSVPVNLLFLGA